MTTQNPATRSVLALLLSLAGQVFTVYFTKRTTGETRRMVAFYTEEGAEKAQYRFNPRAKALLPAWDVEKGAPRLIPLEGVQRIVVAGETIYSASSEFPAAPLEDRPPMRPSKAAEYAASLEGLLY